MGVPTLGKGSRLAIQLDNLSGRDVMLNSKWDIGQLYPVQIADPPKAGHLPEVPGALDNKQKEPLNKLPESIRMCFPRKATQLVAHHWWSTRFTQRGLL